METKQKSIIQLRLIQQSYLLGTKVKIDNQIYVAEDIGGAVKGNVIDVWVETENKNFGRKYKEVFIYE